MVFQSNTFLIIFLVVISSLFEPVYMCWQLLQLQSNYCHTVSHSFINALCLPCVHLPSFIFFRVWSRKVSKGVMQEWKFLVSHPCKTQDSCKKWSLKSHKKYPCKTMQDLVPAKYNRTKGGGETLKKGDRASLLGSRRFLQGQNYFSTMYCQYVPMYIWSCIFCETRVARWDPGFVRKVTYLSRKVLQWDQTLIFQEGKNIKLSVCVSVCLCVCV